jgi:hypothetical protein
VDKLRNKLLAEFRDKKMSGKAGKYVNPGLEKFKEERESIAIKEPLLKKRELELKTLIPELVKECK